MENIFQRALAPVNTLVYFAENNRNRVESASRVGVFIFILSGKNDNRKIFHDDKCRSSSVEISIHTWARADTWPSAMCEFSSVVLVENVNGGGKKKPLVRNIILCRSPYYTLRSVRNLKYIFSFLLSSPCPTFSIALRDVRRLFYTRATGSVHYFSFRASRPPPTKRAPVPVTTVKIVFNTRVRTHRTRLIRALSLYDGRL